MCQFRTGGNWVHLLIWLTVQISPLVTLAQVPSWHGVPKKCCAALLRYSLVDQCTYMCWPPQKDGCVVLVRFAPWIAEQVGTWLFSCCLQNRLRDSVLRRTYYYFQCWSKIMPPFPANLASLVSKQWNYGRSGGESGQFLEQFSEWNFRGKTDSWVPYGRIGHNL